MIPEVFDEKGENKLQSCSWIHVGEFTSTSANINTRPSSAVLFSFFVGKKVLQKPTDFLLQIEEFLSLMSSQTKTANPT